MYLSSEAHQTSLKCHMCIGLIFQPPPTLRFTLSWQHGKPTYHVSQMRVWTKRYYPSDNLKSLQPVFIQTTL